MNETRKNTPPMTVDERKTLKDDIERCKQTISAVDDPVVSDFIQDKDKIRAQIKALEAKLEEGTPERITDPAKRDRVAREREKLAEEIRPYMETHREIRLRDSSSIEWDKAVEKANYRLTNTNHIEDKIKRWKYLGMLLEPDNPNIASLNQLRK